MRRALWLLLPALWGCSGEKVEPASGGSVATDLAALEFGPVFTGETGRLTLRVQNRGRSAGEVKLSVGPPFEATLEGPTTLEPGAIAEVAVSYAPEEDGESSATLEVSVAGVPGKAQVALSGEGASRSLQLERILSFGAVDVGTTAEGELPIRNTSALPQVVTASLGGADALAFELPVARLLIPAGETVPLRARFSPGTAESYSAQLTVRACETCEAVTVLVSGLGQLREVYVTPAKVELGAVPIGTSTTTVVKVVNTNLDPVHVTSVRLVSGAGSPYSVQLPQLPAEVPTGELEIPITFTPTARVVSATSLRIEAEGKLFDVPITGEGGDGGLLVRPDALDFGAVPAAAQPTLEVEVFDAGSGNVRTVRSVRVEGADADRFLVTTSRTLPTSARTDPVDVRVTFQTTRSGTFHAELVIEFDGAPPRRVPLTGVAVAGGYCDLELEPPELRFGLRSFGEPAERTVVLRNPTTLECTAGPFALEGSPSFTLPGTDLEQRRLIAARGTLELKVRYTPARGEALARGELVIGQTSLTATERRVALAGTSSEPVVAVSPAALAFPQGQVGAEQILALNVRNVSPLPLRLAAQRIVTSSGEATLLPAFPVIPVGESVTAHVKVSPSAGGTLADLELEIDGTAAPVIVPITSPRTLASCGASCPGPSASCPAAADAWLQRDGVLTGGTAAGATSCAWSVVAAPGGSTAAPRVKDCQAIFRPDVAGDYELELTATDAKARSATCRTALKVQSYPGLWIESRPRLASESIDPHLFLPAAGELDDPATWSVFTDHAWRVQPRPPWSAAGLDDDPIVEGGGAELPAVIRVPSPATGVTYEVGLLWSIPRKTKELDVDTTVWCGGQAVATITSSFPEIATAVHVGTVSPSGAGCTFTPSNTSILVQP